MQAIKEKNKSLSGEEGFKFKIYICTYKWIYRRYMKYIGDVDAIKNAWCVANGTQCG